MSRKVPAHSKKLDDVVIETDKGKEFTVGEIKHSNRVVKSKTPKQDLSWYVKWTASMFILASMSIRGVDGLQHYDLILSLIGVSGWMWVGFLWKDRALIVLNAIIVFALMSGLVRNFFVL